jgi:hypothetical protein
MYLAEALGSTEMHGFVLVTVRRRQAEQRKTTIQFWHLC